MISNDSLGTKHRNHCPLCLYSNHVDLKTPGDRRSDCRSRMQPIGLTIKDVTYNPFTKRTSGELMLVHKCLNCGKLSINRIAGDDNPYSILSLLENTVEHKDLSLLNLKDKEQILTALFGYDHPNI